MVKNVAKGVILVGCGVASYGMLATFVKVSYNQGYTTAEVTSSQILLGIAGMLLINLFRKVKKGDDVVKATPKNILQLVVAGTSMGFTSIFYYLAVRYIPVSIGIVLLMQTVWMGVVLESLLHKTMPSRRKIIAVIVVLIGTIMATNLLNNNATPDWRGIVLGLLAAMAFTGSMFTSNRIALNLSASQRSLYMLCGGAVIVLSFAALTWTGSFNFDIFYKWGLFLAVFGTIIPPLLLNAGFPHCGIGLGSIVSSLELPVSVTMAFLVLGEKVSIIQWLGIALIIAAVVVMNMVSHRRR